MIGFPDDDAFPDELPDFPQGLVQANDGNLGGLLVAYQHFGLDAVVAKGVHQTVGCNGCTTHSFGCIYDQYSHAW